MRHLRFLFRVLKDYKIGAFSVSSRYVAERILREMPEGCRVVVEYGAGDGAITKRLLRALPAGGRVVAIEQNRELAAELRQIADRRLTVIEDDILSVLRNPARLGLREVDAVISGVPFSFFKKDAREEIIVRTSALLRRSGVFLVYQYSFLAFPTLKRFFREVDVRFEPRNFLPYFIMVAAK
ncbi:MAG: methyltransferase domain-containing protein [Candidatus Liptonbacteria bacterium]|nr:methyltransferase domain-containing protein [Candidatus Liptonbacteria bacterium]